MRNTLLLSLWLLVGCSQNGGDSSTGGLAQGGRAGTADSTGIGGTGAGGMSNVDARAGTAGTGGGGSEPADGATAGLDSAMGERPDGATDATASLANPFVYVGSYLSNDIRIFELNMQTGVLVPRGVADGGPSPDYIAFHPSGKYLYALNEVDPGRVVAFSIDARTGQLTRLNDASSGGDGPAYISVHKSGQWILASNYDSGHAAALPISASGQIGAPVQPVFAGVQAHMIRDDGMSGKFVFVPSKGDNRVLQYKFDETSGKLEPNTPAFVAQSGSPRHMTFHRSGRYAYLLTEAGRSVVSYKYDASTGLLSDAMVLPIGSSGDGSHIVLHPSKEVLYAAIRGYNAIAVLDIDEQGRAANPRYVRDQLATPWDFALDRTGKYLLVANNANATVTVYRVLDDTRMLMLVGSAPVTARPRFVGILSPP